MSRLQRTLSPIAAEGDEGGRVGVVGGSVDFPGQPALVGLAALRTGADDVRLLVSEEIYEVAAGYSPNLLTSRYEGERFGSAAADRAIDVGSRVDALVIGPGLADSDPAAVRRTVSSVDVPVIVDAIAIEPAVDADLSNTVFTPASNEEEWIADAYGGIESFSEETDAVAVRTGDVDEIVAEGERLTNETGTTALSVAGTGDTLTGITAALLAGGLDRVEAAERGAWILGKAGELATAERGPGVVATDVIDRVPDAIR